MNGKTLKSLKENSNNFRECSYKNVHQTHTEMPKFELKVEWKTNEYYDMEYVTLLIPDDKLEAIEKAQAFLKANPDIDSIRVRIDADCLASMSEHRLGYGFVIVRNGDSLNFIGTDNYESSYQVETESFTV